MPLSEGPHKEALLEALALEGEGQRRLLAGDADGARAALREAVAAYRRSWDLAPPGSYGRLIGMVKAGVIAGDGEEEARFARDAIEGDGGTSAPRAYALAVAALVLGDDAEATRAAQPLHRAGEAFARAAHAVDAVAAGDSDRVAAALRAIVSDFERRDEHLTGVPIADTALMLDGIWTRSGHPSALPASPLLPEHA
jgi:hypothetical protein